MRGKGRGGEGERRRVGRGGVFGIGVEDIGG